MVAPPALLTDAAVLLEKDTGYRSEASLHASMHMMNKVFLGAAGVIFQLGLYISSLHEEDNSTSVGDQGILSIRILTVTIPLVLLAISVYCLLRMSKKYSKENVKIIQAELDEEKNSKHLTSQRDDASPESPYMTCFVISGLSSDLLQQMLAQNRLPSIAALADKVITITSLAIGLTLC
jgi:Na+/melibiose symporter-like transporter